MTHTTQNEIRRGVIKWGVKNIIVTLLTAGLLFVAAGRLDWTAGWYYVGTMAAVQIITALILVPRDPELLAERSGLGANAKKWDILLALAMAYSSLLVGIVAGLEVRLTGRLNDFSPVWQWIGVLLTLIGSLFTLWAMVSNPFFSGVVRIQEERGHRVASAGPYGYVRHPGYVGMFLYQLAAPLILSSGWAYGLIAVALPLGILRTALEDRTLQAELTGYREYAQRVRYRLLPGLW